MAYPAGVTTRKFTLGVGTSIENADLLAFKGTLVASRSLVWGATGTPMRNVGTDLSFDAGMQVEHVVPVTDQAGYLDGQGNTFDVTGGKQTHLYTLKGGWYLGAKLVSPVSVGPFPLPTDDQSDVDLDKMIPAPASGGSTIFIPDTWSATLEQAQALADSLAPVADTINTGRLSEASLENTFVASPLVTPASESLWLSNAYRDVHVDPSPGSRFELFTGQEPAVWFEGGKWKMIFTGGLGIAYTDCASDPTIAANWSPLVNLFVPPTGSTYFHGNVYQEGTSYWYYFVNKSDNGIYYSTCTSDPGLAANWSAPVLLFIPAAPPSIGGKSTGNMCVVKDGSTYYLFVEVLTNDVLGPDGTANTWQTWVGTGTSPVSFNDPIATGIELKSLRPVNTAAASGPSIVRENDEWVMYYHSAPWGIKTPTDGFRAVNGNLATDTWKVLDGNRAFIRRAHANEVDQVADLSAARDDKGAGYLFYSANRNYSPAHFYIHVTKLNPTLMIADSDGNWTPAMPRSNGELSVINGYTPWVQNSVPHLDPSGQASQGTWALDTTLAGMVSGCRRVNTSAAINDYIDFDVVLAPGTYNLNWTHSTGPDHADVNIRLAFLSPTVFNKGYSTVSCYSAAATPNVRSVVPITVYGYEAARARIRLSASSKNASSTGYKIGDQGWSLVRTDA